MLFKLIKRLKKKAEKARKKKSKKFVVHELPYQRLVLPNGQVIKVAKVLNSNGTYIVVEDVYGKIHRVKLE